MYDPIKLSQVVEKYVLRRKDSDVLRAYYRFRKDRWYGGIATGDVIGCNLRCRFCWAWRFAWSLNPPRNSFLSPDEVIERLHFIASRYRLSQVRLSGGEPTLGIEHTVKVIEGIIRKGLHMVLETNGVLLGFKRDYAEQIASLHKRDIEVRVSIKGCSPKEFTEITGAKPGAWYLQLKAIENLIEYGLRPGDEVYPAIMLSFCEEENYKALKNILADIDEELIKNIDEEYVIMYDHVKELLRRFRLKPKKYFIPGRIPKEFI